MRERADHCQLVALLCGSPKMLTQLDAGNIGVDSGKLSTDFSRGIGFGIESIDVAWTTPHEKKDTAFRFAKTW